jgi:hypothetical protein
MTWCYINKTVRIIVQKINKKCQMHKLNVCVYIYIYNYFFNCTF